MLAVVVAVSVGSPLTSAAAGGPGASVPTPGIVVRYRPPVTAGVSDPFRAPAHRYGAGNRGIEYRTVAGESVAAVGSGLVAFVGNVAGRLVVSVEHPDGLRSTLTGLASTSVVVGEAVHPGRRVGTAGPALHLGVRRGSEYLDPASLFGRHGPTQLVPVPAALEFGAPPRTD